MLTKEEARELAYNQIKNHCVECVIMDEYTMEEEFGYMFFCQSKQFVQTRHMRDMLVGGGGIIVNKHDGLVQQTGSNRPAEYFAKKYLEEWKRERQNLREGKSA